jgi:hypothetical protein
VCCVFHPAHISWGSRWMNPQAASCDPGHVSGQQ